MSDQSPNVVFVVIDACRADALTPEHVLTPGDSLDPNDGQVPDNPQAPNDANVRTPNLDTFADEATTFRRAVSPAPWTLPSVTSLLTGAYPHEHGATSRGFAQDGGTTLQADLGDAGYETLHLSPKTWIGDWLPQGDGFDRVEEFTGPTHHFFEEGADVRKLSAGVTDGAEWYATVARRALADDETLKSVGNALAFKLSEATGDAWLDGKRASERAADVADDRFEELGDGEDPFFAYVHLMDPHLPFYVPDEFRTDEVRPPGCASLDEEREYIQALLDDVWAIRLGERTLSADERTFLRTRYADEVAYADHAVGEILDAIDRRGLGEETLVAVTGDHGEHLGERVAARVGGSGAGRNGDRTLIDHQTSVRLPVLHVPLLVRYPGEFDGGERDDLVQSHYLASTARALADLDYDRSRSLLSRDASALSETALAEYRGVVPSHPPEHRQDEDALTAPRRSAIVGEWKLDEVAGERFAVRIDWASGETESVALDDVPESARSRLVETLDRGESRAAVGERTVPDGVADNLRELGYMD